MKLIIRTPKEVFSSWNKLFTTEVKTITLSTGIITEIRNGVVTIKD